MIIKEIRAKKILDSRKEETIEVSVDGCRASAPAGKSTGKHETPPYHNSLDWNIGFLNNLKIPFEIKSFNDLKKVEKLICKEIDVKDAKRFGGNALFSLESAILKALAKSLGKELWQVVNPNALKMPVPVGNCIGGGMHSLRFPVHPIFQEFLLIPNEETFYENVMAMRELYFHLGKMLKAAERNDEGAWQVPINNENVFEIISRFRNGTRIGVDIAATSFHLIREYKYPKKFLSPKEQIAYINSLIEKYNLFYIEDPLYEEDFKGFKEIIRSPINLVVGDDLTATHKERLKKAIKAKAINAMIIKPNQNGSLIEVKEIFDICRKHNIKTVLSHRSGETLDASIADYAFAFQADFIKTGIATPEREAKLRRLIEIENSLTAQS